METCVLSLVLAFLCHGVTTFLCDYACDSSVQSDTYLQAPVLSSLSGLGLSMCERKCSSVTGSLAFNYFRPDGKCECLNETSASSAHAVVSREGWHHGDVATPHQVSSTNCTCADGKPCVLDMPGLLRCPLACPLPAPLTGSTVHVTAVSPTAAASYTCLEDFTFFGSSSHVTCTAGGTWEGLNGTCQQTSWTNPTQTVFPIPQPVEAGWRVDIIFNFSDVIAIGLNLRFGSDVHLHASLRVNLPGQPYTVMTSGYGGIWLSEENATNAPWTTGLVFNVTFVLNCPAVGIEMFVNGTLHYVYNNGRPCFPLDQADTNNVARVDRLRMVYP